MMPIDFKLDEYLDIDLSAGDLSFVEDLDEVAQLMAVKSLVNYDEDVYQPETGIKWFGEPSMYDHQSDDTYRELQLRRTYLAIPEITDIPLLTISQDDSMKSIRFYANSIYGAVRAGNA